MDRYNCRLYLAIVLFCFGIMTALVPVASSFVELIVISVVLGVFSGALDCGKSWCTHLNTNIQLVFDAI